MYEVQRWNYIAFPNHWAEDKDFSSLLEAQEYIKSQEEPRLYRIIEALWYPY